MPHTRLRELSNQTRLLVTGFSFSWVCLLLWYASPLSYQLGVFVLNATEVKYLTVGFAIFLSLLCYPHSQQSKNNPIKPIEFLLALVGAGSAFYLFIFYEDLASRAGRWTYSDWGVATVGLAFLIEAARRVLALPVAIITALTLLLIVLQPTIGFQGFFGQYWLTTEGTFGVALGVTTSMLVYALIIGSCLDYLQFGHNALKKIYNHLLPSEKVNTIPAWLDKKFWVWSLAFLYLGIVAQTGVTTSEAIIVQTLLFLVLATPYFLLRTWLRKSQTESKAIWRTVSLFLAVLPIIAFISIWTAQNTLFILLFAAPVSIFRALRSYEGDNRPSVFILLESASLGYALVYLTSLTMASMIFIVGYLWRLIDIPSATTRGIIMPSTTVIGVVLLLALQTTRWKTNALPLAFLSAVILVLSIGLQGVRLSPGLTAFLAIVSGSIIFIISGLYSRFTKNTRQSPMTPEPEPNDLIGWYSLAGKNSVPVIIATAILGIYVGAITQTGFFAHLFG